MKKEMKQHYVHLEERYLEDFIINSIVDELEDKSELKREVAYNKFRFDAVLMNGLPNVQRIPKKEIFLEIKCANNFNYIKPILEKYRNNIDGYICIISYVDEEIYGDNYAILGYSYIEQLAERHPLHWWNYLASIDSGAQVIISDDGKYATMVGDILGGRGIEPVIKSDDIFKLSDINFNDYKSKIKTFKKYPAIILGNGISIPFGSDPWSKVIDTLFDYLNPLYIDNLSMVKKAIGDSNYFAASMSKMTISSSKYNEALKSCIYRKYEKRMHTSDTLIRSVVNAKTKYIDMPLLTYNYDTFLEDDYNLVNSLKMNAVYNEKTDKMTIEPKIKHVHGFCKNTKTATPKNIVLTDEEYFNEYKNGKSWVVSAQKDALENFLCLYVGSSMSDLFQMSIINDVKKEKSKKSNQNGVWYCYALMCLKDLSHKDILTINNYYLQKSVKLIFVKDYSDLATKLDDLFQ